MSDARIGNIPDQLKQLFLTFEVILRLQVLQVKILDSGLLCSNGSHGGARKAIN